MYMSQLRKAWRNCSIESWGGVIIFDDYAVVEGETLAIEEFFADKKILLKKFPFSHGKPSYIVKE